MSSGNPSKDIRQDARIQSFPSANNNHHNIERQTSMSVGYLTRTQHSRDRPPYDINSNFIYTQPTLMQPSNNIPQQQPQSQPQQSPQQYRGSYDRPPSGHSRHASSIQSTSSSASSHSTAQQTPRITLPPLSAITENQEAQTEGSAPVGQNSQNGTASSQHPPPQIQQQQQPQQAQQQQPQTQQQQLPPQPSPSYPQRPPVQYESQQGSFPTQRHLQPSPQLPSDQSRYQSGPAPPQQIPLQPHQMSVAQLQPNPQIGQFPSPSPTPTHFPPQSQYAYPQPQYPPQSMYGQYPPHQMPPGMPPGIPYQPAYATSHRQRPPQFTPYPPPPSGFAPPPQGGPPQGWPQDYIAQPLTPLTGHSPQQQYSPQSQQMSGPGGPMRIRRTSSGLPQPTYAPPQGELQPPSQPQSTLKPKRKRATSGQLRVLNNVFASTFFPSTELRIALGKELNMSPRTVQIWFQNKRQSWRASKAKSEPGSGPAQQHHSGGTPSSQTFSASGSFSPHPLRQEQHFASSPSHVRMPSSAEESGREEGMENDEGGGWEALRQAQQENRDYRPGVSSGEGDEDGFEDEGINSPHHRHR